MLLLDIGPLPQVVSGFVEVHREPIVDTHTLLDGTRKSPQEGGCMMNEGGCSKEERVHKEGRMVSRTVERGVQGGCTVAIETSTEINGSGTEGNMEVAEGVHDEQEDTEEGCKEGNTSTMGC